MAVQGALWLAKHLSLNLNFCFLNRILLLLNQVATQLSSWGWVDPIPDPILPEKFPEYSRESNPGPLGWQSDLLTTIPNRQSVVVVVVVYLGFTMLLTSQVIRVTFYSEREKPNKFCSEALILAWGSSSCNKSTSRDPCLYFLSVGSHSQDFYALKNPSTPAGFEPVNVRSSGEW